MKSIIQLLKTEVDLAMALSGENIVSFICFQLLIFFLNYSILGCSTTGEIDSSLVLRHSHL